MGHLNFECNEIFLSFFPEALAASIISNTPLLSVFRAGVTMLVIAITARAGPNNPVKVAKL